MSSRWKIVCARAGRTCTECRRDTIHPGDDYLVASVPPNHPFNGTGAWRAIGACLSCADADGLHTDATRAQLASRSESSRRS